MLSKAIALTATLFQDKHDKGGNPYILHCLYVMEKMPKDDPELQQIAVLHDVVEDTDTSFDDLHNMGFSTRVVAALELLTHGKESYMDYIEKIATNPDAVKVKLADLRHNSDITRMKGIHEKDIKRLEKYHRAYKYLMEL